MNYGDHNLI